MRGIETEMSQLRSLRSRSSEESEFERACKEWNVQDIQAKKQALEDYYKPYEIAHGHLSSLLQRLPGGTHEKKDESKVSEARQLITQTKNSVDAIHQKISTGMQHLQALGQKREQILNELKQESEKSRSLTKQLTTKLPTFQEACKNHNIADARGRKTELESDVGELERVNAKINRYLSILSQLPERARSHDIVRFAEDTLRLYGNPSMFRNAIKYDFERLEREEANLEEQLKSLKEQSQLVARQGWVVKQAYLKFKLEVDGGLNVARTKNKGEEIKVKVGTLGTMNDNMKWHFDRLANSSKTQDSRYTYAREKYVKMTNLAADMIRNVDQRINEAEREEEKLKGYMADLKTAGNSLRPTLTQHQQLLRSFDTYSDASMLRQNVELMKTHIDTINKIIRDDIKEERRYGSYATEISSVENIALAAQSEIDSKDIETLIRNSQNEKMRV
jgi:DNA repair exonuclease SbcCD ATPase subunit